MIRCIKKGKTGTDCHVPSPPPWKFITQMSTHVVQKSPFLTFELPNNYGSKSDCVAAVSDKPFHLGKRKNMD